MTFGIAPRIIGTGRQLGRSHNKTGAARTPAGAAQPHRHQQAAPLLTAMRHSTTGGLPGPIRRRHGAATKMVVVALSTLPRLTTATLVIWKHGP